MGKPRATQTDKVRWLLDHQPLWQGWTSEFVISDTSVAARLQKSVEQRSRSERLICAMRAEGLYSDTTSDTDIALSLITLIPRARNVRARGLLVSRSSIDKEIERLKASARESAQITADDLNILVKNK